MAVGKSAARRCFKQQAKDHTFIYALSDPRTGKVRYVGKTCRSVEYRLYEHIREASTSKRYAVSSWINKLIRLHHRPIITILEIIPADGDWREAECRWIATWREREGTLLNLTDGGDGTSGYVASLEVRQKLSRIAIAQGRKPVGNKGRVFGPEARARMAAAKVGRRHKLSQAEIERRKLKRSPWTDEQRARTLAGRARRNYIATPEHRENLSKSGKIAWESRSVLENLAKRQLSFEF